MTMRRAADEIERLRHELAEAQSKLNLVEAEVVSVKHWAKQELAEARGLLENAVANCDKTGYEGAAAWADRRDAFLAGENP
jgi:hypothetical protein